MFKKLIVISALIIASIGLIGLKTVKAQSVPPTTTPTTSTNYGIKITTDKLTAAGFNDVTAQAAQVANYLPPNFYFHVKETVPASFGWGVTSNLVAVFIMPKIDTSWQLNNGQMSIQDIAGRTQASITTANYYIVVTGPDKQKVINLTKNLATLY